MLYGFYRYIHKSVKMKTGMIHILKSLDVCLGTFNLSVIV